MKRGGRRRLLVLGASLLVVLLVGGRWLALETAERAWAASLPGGATYLAMRDYARLVSGLFLLAAVAWCTGNLLFVYRAIGSVQLPRRLGDLEIVEAVPQPVLLAGTIASGLAFGFVLALGTGDWWMQAALASRVPSFGVTDPVLHRDLGYYLAELPWSEHLRGFALAATMSATVAVALLYAGIGSLRFRRWLPYASAHARTHLGVVLATLALALLWDAVLDPAETIAGLHGPLTRGALAVRLPAAPLVITLAVAAALASLLWVVRERPALLAAAWGALAATWLLVYVIVPASIPAAAPRRRAGGPLAALLAAEPQRLEQLAFGVGPLVTAAPPGFASPDAAVAAVPLWDGPRAVAAAARQRDLLGSHAAPAAAAPSLRRTDGTRVTWLVAPMPDLDSVANLQPPRDWTAIHRGAWARVGPPLAAMESDTGLAFTRAPTRDSVAWFGPGFAEFAVAAPDTWPALRDTGIPLAGRWRRAALAWALQSPELARSETDGLILLWRRDVTTRLSRLAPFASFDQPTPLVADGALWWVAYGYLEAEAFPLARALDWDGRPLRYLRPALLGAVNAASGDTRLYLVPGADSLARAWGTLLAPLIRPAASVPAALRTVLPYPRRAFRVATLLIARWHADSVPWRPRPREPFELIAPRGDGAADTSMGAWIAQGFEAGSTFAALVAGHLVTTGPQLFLWQPRPGVRLPAVLVGSPNATAPGVLRLWNAGGALFSEQALFAEPAAGGPASRIDSLFLTWGEREGQGAGPAATTTALRDLLAAGRGAAGREGGRRALADTSLAGRWEAARRLAQQADAALAAGDLEAFARLFTQLEQLLGVGRRKLAPTPGPR